MKKPPFSGGFGTAYESRTHDLLRERQMSWTTRRMRRLLWTISLTKSGAKVQTFFELAKYFSKKSFTAL